MAVTEIVIPLQQPVELLPRADSVLQAQVRGEPQKLRNGARSMMFLLHQGNPGEAGRHQKQPAWATA